MVFYELCLPSFGFIPRQTLFLYSEGPPSVSSRKNHCCSLGVTYLPESQSFPPLSPKVTGIKMLVSLFVQPVSSSFNRGVGSCDWQADFKKRRKKFSANNKDCMHRYLWQTWLVFTEFCAYQKCVPIPSSIWEIQSNGYVDLKSEWNELKTHDFSHLKKKKTTFPQL